MFSLLQSDFPSANKPLKLAKHSSDTHVGKVDAL
jgi:hypothetical protein